MSAADSLIFDVGLKVQRFKIFGRAWSDAAVVGNGVSAIGPEGVKRGSCISRTSGTFVKAQSERNREVSVVVWADDAAYSMDKPRVISHVGGLIWNSKNDLISGRSLIKSSTNSKTSCCLPDDHTEFF